MRKVTNMETRVFDNIQDFRNRKDRWVNGVSKEFAETHPDFVEQNSTNTGCWNCSNCSNCNSCTWCDNCFLCLDCHMCTFCSHSKYSNDCRYCVDCHCCHYCTDCFKCRSCKSCAFCNDCSGCSGCKGVGDNDDCDNRKGGILSNIPTIKHIHNKVYASTLNEKALCMSEWHSCKTTHCRAGWVVHLAGAEGYSLENRTSTLFAAMQIYKASSDIRVPSFCFFDSDEEAMIDIKRCADYEIETKGKYYENSGI